MKVVRQARLELSGGSTPDQSRPPQDLLEAPVRKIILQMARTGAHKSVLESANPRMGSECASGCTWSTARATARLCDGPTLE